MRKKGHKKINGGNKNYDKFYMINHLELGRSWEEVQQDKEGDRPSEERWVELIVCTHLLQTFATPQNRLQKLAMQVLSKQRFLVRE